MQSVEPQVERLTTSIALLEVTFGLTLFRLALASATVPVVPMEGALWARISLPHEGHPKTAAPWGTKQVLLQLGQVVLCWTTCPPPPCPPRSFIPPTEGGGGGAWGRLGVPHAPHVTVEALGGTNIMLAQLGHLNRDSKLPGLGSTWWRTCTMLGHQYRDSTLPGLSNCWRNVHN